jgi:hypothetical protein
LRDYVHTAATSHLHSDAAFELARRRRASAVARQDADRVAAQTRQCAAPSVRDGIDWDGRALLGRGEDKERRRQSRRAGALLLRLQVDQQRRHVPRRERRHVCTREAAQRIAWLRVSFTRAGGRKEGRKGRVGRAFSAQCLRSCRAQACGLSAPVHRCQTWAQRLTAALKRTAFGHGVRQRAAAVLLGCARQRCGARCRLRRRTFGARFGQRVRQQQHVAHIGRHLACNRTPGTQTQAYERARATGLHPARPYAACRAKKTRTGQAIEWAHPTRSRHVECGAVTPVVPSTPSTVYRTASH